MAQLVLVEDDRNLAGTLRTHLEGEGYSVTWYDRGDAFQPSDVIDADLFLLDWMLPGLNGFDILKLIRQNSCLQPVIFLTARDEVIDKVLALECGANDYLTKPFEIRELMARIRAHLRTWELTSKGRVSGDKTERPQGSVSEGGTLLWGEVTLNPEGRAAWFRGELLALKRLEFNLLELFVRNPGKVYTRHELLDLVWGYEAYPTTRTVDNHVAGLRRKLAPAYIETLHGVGYRILKPRKEVS